MSKYVPIAEFLHSSNDLPVLQRNFAGCTPLHHCRPFVDAPGYNRKANEGVAKPEQRSHYQSIIGSLLFLALGTRPDIAHAVIMMPRFMVNPSEEHIQ